ncbi:MAG TPA: hypothetical protein VJS91_10290 [Nitrososphaeraceae archaeon]|nr:hypothetical protein [Nitrososphaeraceae archaeon]
MSFSGIGAGTPVIFEVPPTDISLFCANIRRLDPVSVAARVEVAMLNAIPW